MHHISISVKNPRPLPAAGLRKDCLVMTLTSVKELFKQTAQYADKTVRVGGWVRSNRASKNLSLIHI